MIKTGLYYYTGNTKCGANIVTRPKVVRIDNNYIIPPSEEQLLSLGYKPVFDDNDTEVESARIEVKDTCVIRYNNVVNEEAKKVAKVVEVQSRINAIDLTNAIERLIAKFGVTDKDKADANERIALRDELGKIIMTEEGDGMAYNPYKWTEGKKVTAGNWYKTPSGYLWEAIADGIPASETDTNYFDVVGL